MTALTVVEWRAWNVRKVDYWRTHRYVCHRCGRPGGDRWWRKPRVLEVHHLNYDMPRGQEYDYDIVGLCKPCHDLVHRRIDRHSRAQGWMRGPKIVDHANHYATFPRFTYRYVKWGRRFAWRDGFPGLGRLPELDW